MFRDICIICAILLSVVFPILSPSQTIVEGDMLIFFSSLYQLPTEGIWSPDFSGGIPRFENPQLGILYPPAWLLGVDFHLFLPFYYIIHGVIAALGIRYWLGVYAPQSHPLVGMIIYACSGTMWGLITKLDKLPGMAFLPWFLFGLTLLNTGSDRKKGWWFAVLAFVCSWFGGSVEGCVIMVFWGLALVLLSEEKKSSFLWLCAVGAVSGLIISINFLPLLLHLPYTTRSEGIAFEEATELSMAFVDFFRLIWPEDDYFPFFDIAARQHYLPSIHIGVVGVVLLGMGICYSKKNTRSLGWIFLFFVVLALGSHTPLYNIVSYIPLLKTIQYPEKYWLGVAPILALFCAQGAAVWPLRRNMVGVLCAFLVIELLVGGYSNFQFHNPKDVFVESSLAKTIRAHQKIGKIKPLLWDDSLQKTQGFPSTGNQALHKTIHDILYPNVGLEFGIGYILGADRLRIRRHGQVVASAIASNAPFRHRLLRRMGVSYFLTWREEDQQELARETPLTYLKEGLFWDAEAFPYVSWSGRVLRAEKEADVLALMASPTTAVMVLEGDPNVQSIPILEDNLPPEYFRCQVEAQIPLYRCTWDSQDAGLITIRQNWLPGWYADLDGVSHPVARVNMYMIGLYAPAGEHEITLKYRPNGFFFGGMLGMLGIVSLVLVSRRLSIGKVALKQDLPVHNEQQSSLQNLD